MLERDKYMKSLLLPYIERSERYSKISLFILIVTGMLFLCSTVTLNYALMWFTLLSLYTLTALLSLNSKSRSEATLFAILYFFIAVRLGYFLRMLFQDGYTVLPADSSFSRYLTVKIIDDGRIMAGRYVGFAKKYCFYPLSFIFSAILLMTTSIPSDVFSGLIYNVIVDICTILVLYLAITIFVARLNLRGNLAAFALVVFLSNVRFLHLFRQFRYENIAFMHLATLSYLIISLLVNSRTNSISKFISIPLIVSLLAFSIVLSHNVTWFFELLLLSIILMWYLIFKIYRSNTNTSRAFKIAVLSILLSIVVTSFSLAYTMAQSSINLIEIIITEVLLYLEDLEEGPVGLERFNPFDYTELEIGMILIGNILMAVLLTISFLLLFRDAIINNDPYHLLLVMLTGTFGSLSFVIIVFSPFKVTIFERAYLYLLWFGCLLPMYVVSRIKRKQLLKPLIIVILMLFFVSQTLIRHHDRELADNRGFCYGIIYEAGKFLARNGIFRHGTIAGFPQHAYTIVSTAIGIESGPLVPKVFYYMFLNKTLEMIFESDVFLFYNMPLEKLRMYVPSQYMEAFIETATNLPKLSNVIFSNGYVIAYKP